VEKKIDEKAALQGQMKKWGELVGAKKRNSSM
jgi:hypothetical protein